MRTTITLIFSFFLCCSISAQVISDFENFGLSVGESILEDVSGDGFVTGAVSLPNVFNANYGSWTGWVVSAENDITTPGFTNDRSAITGGGFDGSITYGTANMFGTNTLRLVDTSEFDANELAGMYITNSTYAYLSMLDGDSFAKKFGGETGEDPDFFSIVFKKYLDGVLSTDSVEFFLADFRSSNPDEDFILNEWTWVDLSSLGELDSLSYVMRSSDIGAYGINTPLYFCVDNIEVNGVISTATSDAKLLNMEIYPTLVKNSMNLSLESDKEATIKIVSLTGKQCYSSTFTGGQTNLNVEHLPSGYYILELFQGGARGVQKIIKE